LKAEVKFPKPSSYANVTLSKMVNFKANNYDGINFT